MKATFEEVMSGFNAMLNEYFSNLPSGGDTNVIAFQMFSKFQDDAKAYLSSNGWDHEEFTDEAKRRSTSVLPAPT